MNDPLNLIWVLVDSIRTYPTDEDLRGKLPVMERFASGSVEFSTCVTTAPSTIMSITAMMTGLPAYFVARNYDNFRFDPSSNTSLSAVLTDHGYSSFAFLRGPETREKFENLLDPVPRKYWPRHLRHGIKWTNRDLNLVLERVLSAGVRRPAFFFFHYNPHTRSERKLPMIDEAVSDRVERALAELARSGFDESNSVIVLCSDHGFPDPSTGLTSEWEAKHRLSHDLVLTDDNILIPLYFRYPGCESKRIEVPVSSLDIFPTVLDLLGISDARAKSERIDGVSLLPLMRSGLREDYPRRFFRSDSRLMFQTGRSTAIRTENLKYIRYHDRNRFTASGDGSESAEVLLDLASDPQEDHNLLTDEPLTPAFTQALREMRSEFERTERRAVEHQVRYLMSRQSRAVGKVAGRVKKILLMFEPAASAFEAVASHALRSVFPDAQLNTLTFELGPNGLSSARPSGTKVDDAEEGHLPGVDRASIAYGLVLVLVQDDKTTTAKALLKMADATRASRRFVLDCNFNTYRRERYWYYRALTLTRALSHVWREPRFVLLRLQTGVSLLLRNLLMRLRLWERWNSAHAERAAGDDSDRAG